MFDVGASSARRVAGGVSCDCGALYWPWVEVADPYSQVSGARINAPPSGMVAGLYARIAGQNGLDQAMVEHYGTGYAVEAPTPEEAHDQPLVR